MTTTGSLLDCHVDLPWLPPDLFTSNASAALKDRMPYVVDGPEGPSWTTKSGVSFGFANSVGSVGKKFVAGANHRVDIMAGTGLYDDGQKGIRRPTDPHLRVKDMERDGVQAEVIFGILGAASRLQDHEAAIEMFRSTTTGSGTSAGTTPIAYRARLSPTAIRRPLSCRGNRAAKLGLRGVEFLPLGHGAHVAYGLGSVLEGHQRRQPPAALPTPFRSSRPSARRSRGRPSLPPRTSPASAGFQMNLINILAAVIGAGVLERYPTSASRSGESGIGWLAYALDRMDFEWEDRFRHLTLKMRPSEYWRRQCKATFQYDRIGTKLVDDIGVETLMWGSDYPHRDGVWPDRPSTSTSSSATCPPSSCARSPATTPSGSTAWRSRPVPSRNGGAGWSSATSR